MCRHPSWMTQHVHPELHLPWSIRHIASRSRRKEMSVANEERCSLANSDSVCRRGLLLQQWWWQHLQGGGWSRRRISFSWWSPCPSNIDPTYWQNDLFAMVTKIDGWHIDWHGLRQEMLTSKDEWVIANPLPPKSGWEMPFSTWGEPDQNKTY